MPAALPDGATLRGELYQASHCDATISIHKKWKSVNKNLKNLKNPSFPGWKGIKNQNMVVFM